MADIINKDMGNGSLNDIRQQTIRDRDRRMQSYLPQFQQIIRQTAMSRQLIANAIDADLVQLVELLNSYQVTSLQLVAIFGLRVIFVGLTFAAITEDYFQFALRKAKICDDQRKKSGKRNWTMDDELDRQKYLPPLFGVPISVKDNIEMAGTRSTVGLTKRANSIIEEDSPMVRCFKNSGMIPFVKTNIPQLGFTTQTNNYLWGRCLNPWNKNKSSGGSSGGEAACIASKVSPIGVGNDYGGSVRIPAQFCGICALLPSPNRVLIQGAITSYSLAFNGKDFIKNLNGPLGRSVDSLALWMHVVTTEEYYEGFHDPYIKLIPFDCKLYRRVESVKQGLRIGYFEHLELIECSPACARALRETVSFLKSEGHEVIEIKIPHEDEVVFTMFAQSMGEGGLASFKDMLQGEPLAPEYKMMDIMGKITGVSFNVLKFIIKLIQPRVGIIMQASKKLTTHEYFEKIGRGYKLREEWIRYWKENKLDLVICPGFGSEATNHGAYDKISFQAAYTFIWNILAMTVCSVPITVVREDEQYYESRWKDEFTKAIKQSARDSQGLPVGVQIIGLPFEEEKVLGMGKKLEGRFKFYENHPLPRFEDVYYGVQ